MSRYNSPIETITDGNGAPMVGAKLVFYATGTSTLKTIYSDSGLSVPMTNPVTAVSSGAGAIYPDIYLDGIYKVVQQDDAGTAGVADGVVLWTRDPVGDVATGNFATWLNDSTYDIPEVVYASDDNYYISLVDANQGNEPSASPVQWQLIPVKDMASRKQIIDDDGNEIVIFSGVASAVNEITVTNAATGNLPSINQTGEDVGLTIEGMTVHNGALTGASVDVTGDVEGASLTIAEVSGTEKPLIYSAGVLFRWKASSADTTDDYWITRFNDAGAGIDVPFKIIRSTGLCIITNLDPASVGTAISGQAAGDLGTEAWLVKRTVNSGIVANTNYAGSDLAYSGGTQNGLGGNIFGAGVGSALSGTWKAKGSVAAVSDRYSATLFTKVAT